MQKHKNKLLNLAAIFASRQGAFLMAVIGIIVQAYHTFHIALSLSSLEGWQKYLQAILLSLFLSLALLYFTLKSSEADTDQAAKYRKMVLWFAIMESAINIWYYAHKLIYIPWPEAKWFDLAIAIPLSFLLPVILKQYGSEVRVDEIEVEPEPVLSEDQVAARINEIVNSEDFVTKIVELVAPHLEVTNNGLSLAPQNEQVQASIKELFSNPQFMKLKFVDNNISKTLNVQMEYDGASEIQQKLKEIV